MSRRAWPALSALIALLAVVLSGCATRAAAGSGATSHSRSTVTVRPHSPTPVRSRPPAATGASSATRPAVYVSCTATAEKPSRIGRCGDGAVVITGVHWSSYGQRTATGTATLRLNSCQPNCATGRYVSLPARLRLSHVATVGGQQVFTRLSLAYGPHHARHMTLHLGR